MPRLQKFLADAGIGSRRYCEELIKSGEVTVNGKTAEIGCTVEHTDEVIFQKDNFEPLHNFQAAEFRRQLCRPL